MANEPSTVGEHDASQTVLGIEPLEGWTASTFTAGGVAILASLVVPAALGMVVEWAWASGVALVGVGVVSLVAGLGGLYPPVKHRSPALARIGAVGTGAAGVAGLALVVLAVAAAAMHVGASGELPEAVGLFGMLVLGVSASLSVGFLSFGVAMWRHGRDSRTAGMLLTAGGSVLLAAVVGELLRSVVGVGPPPVVVFPVVIVVALDALAIGHSL